MYRRIFYLIFSIILAATIYGQDQPVATIGNIEISSKEYLKRFELTPRVRTSANIDSQKTHFLYTLVAEKLWADEARTNNLDTLYSYKQYINNLEKMLVRDALFKDIIESRVNITEQNINDAIEKSRYELNLNFLFSKSKNEIDSLYEQLGKIGIDSLLETRSEKTEQTEPIKVVFGQLDENLENTLFDLKPGEYTRPIFNEIGWVIYYLKNKRELNPSELGDENELGRHVQKVISDRQKQSLVKNYLNSLLSGVEVNTDGELFQLLAEKLTQILSEKYSGQTHKSFVLYEDDLIKLINNIPHKLSNRFFIKFKNNPVTFKEFLYYIYFNNFTSSGTDINSVKRSLYNVVQDFISFEVIAREAYEKGYDQNPEVQEELKMWEDNFLSQYLRNTFNAKAKVTELELNQYLSEQADSAISTKFASLTEVRLNNLQQAQQILTQLSINYNFSDIIERLNILSSNIIKTEMQPIVNYGDLASIIDNMSKGEVYGPIVRSDGYSIIELTDVETREFSNIEKNKLQTENQKQILFYKKLQSLLTKETVELAEKYGITINENLLNKIEVTEIPTLIYRFYGFGGQTVAAPFANSFYEWFNEYKNKSTNPL